MCVRVFRTACGAFVLRRAMIAWRINIARARQASSRACQRPQLPQPPQPQRLPLCAAVVAAHEDEEEDEGRRRRINQRRRWLIYVSAERAHLLLCALGALKVSSCVRVSSKTFSQSKPLAAANERENYAHATYCVHMYTCLRLCHSIGDQMCKRSSAQIDREHSSALCAI